MSIRLLEEYIESGDCNSLNDLLSVKPTLALEKTSFNVSPLMLSCYYKKPEITKVILLYHSVLDLHEAAASGKFENLAHLVYKNPDSLNLYSSDGFTALGLAVYFGQEDATRFLLLKGADVNLPSDNGYRVYPIHSAVSSNNNVVAKMLLEAGADVNVRQQSGITPLHFAAQNGNIELLILLLEAGSDINVKLEDGKTPANVATENGHHDIAKILST